MADPNDIDLQAADLVRVALSDLRALRRLFWMALGLFGLFMAVLATFMVLMGAWFFRDFQHFRRDMEVRENQFDQRFQAAEHKIANPAARPENWDKVDVGMKAEEVRRLLGKPAGVHSMLPAEETWDYAFGSRVTLRHGRVAEYTTMP